MYKRDYAFRMNVMEEIFEIRSCIEVLALSVIRVAGVGIAQMQHIQLWSQGKSCNGQTDTC